MRSLVIACLVVANLASGLPARAERNPYWAIVGWNSMAVCTGRYGVLTTEEGMDRILMLAKKNFGMDDWQVVNIMKSPGFKKDVERAIDEAGGCKRIAEKIKGKLE
jgi:hypothetical protein